MNAFELYWHNALSERKEQGIMRKLLPRAGGTDFYSNDYLGLAVSKDFQQLILNTVCHNTRYLTGATGARLISGNSPLSESTEAYIAGVHQTEDALLFPSGYKANIALFSCITRRGDTIIVDESVHRSVHDGCLMSRARKWKFRHNDMDHLESLLKKVNGNAIIAVESLYSMDGDFAPLKAIADLAAHYGAGVVVDEAHAIGVFGKGLVNKAGLQCCILATVVTYGKAMGTQGAAILGSRLLKEYLVNFASPFIYSTAMSDVQVLSVRTAYEYLLEHEQPAATLQECIRHFRKYNLSEISCEESPVQVIRFPDADQLRNTVSELRRSDIQTYAVFPPTVPEGGGRLRICLHQFNSKQEIDGLCAVIKKYV